MIILMWKRKVLRTRDKEIVDLADAGTMRYNVSLAYLVKESSNNIE